jgi:phosphoribosylformylglycinamidine synthase subunit PurQ / glutaminase
MTIPPKIAIIEFPGSNCETESLQAIRDVGMIAEEFLWNRAAGDLEEFDGYFIIGGFSYEDRSRSGVISSKDPLMKELIKQSQKGKPIIGICNGAQVLIESGLVPGLRDNKLGGALAVNKREKDGKILGTGFYNTWVNIKMTGSTGTAFTNKFEEGESFNVPIAHGEGRFVFDQDILDEMQSNGQLVFAYSNEDGVVVDEFPTNPNGSILGLAGVTNPSGNVLALMPHPERSKCLKIFESMKEYIIESSNSKEVFESKYLISSVVVSSPNPYVLPSNSKELIIEMVITDNEAVTVEQTLNKIGIKCKITKFNHFEVNIKDGADISSVYEQVVKSGELYNSNKENPTKVVRHEGVSYVLVRYKEDFVGQSKVQILGHFGITNIESIRKGVLWRIEGDMNKVLETNIICNPFSQVAMIYNPQNS